MSAHGKISGARLVFVLAACLVISACTPSAPLEGPDKQGGGLLQGAVTGAGAGAVTGFQVGAGAGPGALVGAGFGAVAGSVHGVLQDFSEDATMQRVAKTKEERERAYATQVLIEHFKRRAELFPGRDIFPADIFFDGDRVALRPEAHAIVREIARLNKRRVPWSRIIIASYAKSADADSNYARHLGERRAREIVDYLVASGLEPRRLEARAVVMDSPLVLDPLDNPLRYSQAIEFIAIDK